jgi:glycosyltransferase involved in cell wall biosynthesis
VLFAHYGLDWVVGSERCLLDLLGHIDRQRFRPVLVCNSATLADAARSMDVTTYCGPEFASVDALWPGRRLSSLGRQLIRRERIELIHANSFEPVKWLLPAARAAKVPVVLHVHVPSTEAERCYSWSHQAACVVGVSETAVRGFRADRLRSDRIRVIYNAVDPQRLAAGDATHLRETLGLDPQTVVIGIVGSLIPRKAIDTVIRSAAVLRSQGRTGFRIISLGDGPELNHLTDLAAQLGIADLVAFLGRRADAGAVLRDVVDVVVTAARQEAFPLNVLEAGYFGLPVIASDIAPHKESIVDGVTGLLVPVDDTSAFASALARLMDSPDLRRSLGTAARERVHDHFIIDRYVTAFTSLYEELLAEPRSRYGWREGTTWPPVYSRWLRRVLRTKFTRGGRRPYVGSRESICSQQ